MERFPVGCVVGQSVKTDTVSCLLLLSFEYTAQLKNIPHTSHLRRHAVAQPHTKDDVFLFFLFSPEFNDMT